MSHKYRAEALWWDAIDKGNLDLFYDIIGSMKEEGRLNELDIEDMQRVLQHWNERWNDHDLHYDFDKERKCIDEVYSAVKCLIDNGVSVKDTNMISFCMCECKYASIKLLELLYQNGADIDKNFAGQPGITRACYGENASLEAIQFFLDKNADVNAVNYFTHENALMYFCRKYAFPDEGKYFPDEGQYYYEKIAKRLIAKTSNLNAVNEDGETATSILKKRANKKGEAPRVVGNCKWLINEISREQNRRDGISK